LSGTPNFRPSLMQSETDSPSRPAIELSQFEVGRDSY
jgi:hypothetical protein